MRFAFLTLSLLVTAAALAHPGSAIAVAADGRVFFVDTGRGNFVIERDGRVVRQEGPAFHWFALDAAGRFARTPWPSLPGAEFRSADALVLSSDYPVAVGRDGALYFALLRERLQLMRITPDGASSLFATLPAARWINGLTAAPDGSLYYTEDRAVRKVDAHGVVSTIVDNVSVANCASTAGGYPLPYLRGLAVAEDGAVYVAAAGCGALLKVVRGRAMPVLRMRAPWSPTAVAIANGELYVLEYLHTPGDDRREWIPRVRKITRDGRQVMLTK